MHNKKKFKVVIESEHDAYVVHCPALDISSQGNSVKEARQNINEAIELFLKIASKKEVRERISSRASRLSRINWGSLVIMSGEQVCDLYSQRGFRSVRRQGCHTIIQKSSADSTTTIPVPNYSQLKQGTLWSILWQSMFSTRELES